MSFYNVTWAGGAATWTPVGLTHYRAVFADKLFQAGVCNTTIFAFGAVAGQMVLGFVLALFCSRITRGRVLYRALFILPILIPGIVVGRDLEADAQLTTSGSPTRRSALLGLEPLRLAGRERDGPALRHPRRHLALDAVLLPALPGRAEVHAAGRLRGRATSTARQAWQELVYVTLPMMLPTIMVTFAFRLVLAFKVFDEVYLLTGGGPGTATEVVSFTLYQRFFTEDRVGYGAAMSIIVIFLVSLLLVLALSARRRSESRGHERDPHRRPRTAVPHLVLAALRAHGRRCPCSGSSPLVSARRSRCSSASSSSRPTSTTSTRCCSRRPRTSC